jgi:LPXTG-motif cell wall-anchored protein
MRHRWLPRVAVVLAVGAASVFAWSTPALADNYSPPFNQAAQLPISAEDFLGTPEECEGAPADQDLWHFVLTTNDAHFVQLTVTFDPGGTQVITGPFGPPTDKHAFAFSEPGAELTAVSAIASHDADADHDAFFVLSHTCAGETPPSSPPPSSPPPSSPPGETSSPPGETSSPPGGAGLPVTGAPLGGLIAVGLGLVAGGAALLYARRRRDQLVA